MTEREVWVHTYVALIQSEVHDLAAARMADKAVAHFNERYPERS